MSSAKGNRCQYHCVVARIANVALEVHLELHLSSPKTMRTPLGRDLAIPGSLKADTSFPSISARTVAAQYIGKQLGSQGMLQ